MKKFFNPKSIAVIGVSRNPQKIGYLIFDNLLACSNVNLYGINPNATEVLGQDLYKSVLDVRGAIDLAVIAVPQKLVIQTLEACGKKKIGYVIVITSGFSEAGPAGKKIEEEISWTAQKHKIRVLGPNCLGLINNFKGINASFATAKLPTKHKVGIFSQSGAMGAAILDFANEQNFGFSYFVSLGNKLDISEADIINAWAEDENVAVGVGYLEDIKNGPSFIAAAKKFTAKKPLVLLKGGTTRAGGRAASLHTSAMTQDSEVFRAACRECGIVLAKNIEDLFELAVDFSINKAPKGNKLTIISNAGGPAVLAADAASIEKIQLPSPSPYTFNQLLKKTFAASVQNPIDLRGDASATDFREAISLCLSDSKTDGILVIVTPQAMTEVEEIAWQVVAAQQKSKKPIYVNFIGGELVAKAKEICRENGVSVFSYPERAIHCFRYQVESSLSKRTSVKAKKKHKNHVAAKSIIRFSNKNMTPAKISSIMSLYNIPMAQEVLVRSPEEAGKALEKIVAPVVMKISSPDILHKTDVGGVILGVKNAEEAKDGYNKIIKNVKKNCPKAQIKGVIVMETAKEGLELIVGLKRDEVFGPVLMFGAGGILVELISDYRVEIGPFDEAKIKKMISGTRVARIINGYRKNNKYNEDKLIEIILNLVHLFSDHQEIRSIEINPVILSDDGKGAIGLDAKIELE